MPKIELVKSPENCCGCGACALSCSTHAIVMTAGKDGSKYPVICEEKCIQCGRCVAVCEETHSAPTHMPIEAYAALGRDAKLIRNSSSGGVFASLAREHFGNGGMVAGAVMELEESVEVYHCLSACEADLGKMQGSKYVQSDAWKCYQDVLSELASGKQVLFCGTPCQTSAIQKLSNNPLNLITIDLVCHGTPSSKMLSEYIAILSQRLKGTIVQIAFRDKSIPNKYCARIDCKKAGKLISCHLASQYLSFYRYFLKSVISRDSCFACPYAKTERTGDLTIGDYWGINQMHKEDFETGRMPKRSDWSCILVNTPKGKDFLQAYKHSLELFATKPEWIAQHNEQLNRPVQVPQEREKIMQLYQNGGYAAVENEFIRSSGGKLRYTWRLLKNMYMNQKRANGVK